jgi:hypothetical protein
LRRDACGEDYGPAEEVVAFLDDLADVRSHPHADRAHVGSEVVVFGAQG